MLNQCASFIYLLLKKNHYKAELWSSNSKKQVNLPFAILDMELAKRVAETHSPLFKLLIALIENIEGSNNGNHFSAYSTCITAPSFTAVVDTRRYISKYRCLQACDRHGDCIAAQYYTDTGICEMVSWTGSDQTLVPHCKLYVKKVGGIDLYNFFVLVCILYMCIYYTLV